MSRIQAPAAFEKHSIPPFFDSDSQILILGSFPSVKSRESGFYYGHPQNRFWRVLSSVFDAPLPVVCLGIDSENLCKMPWGIHRLRSRKWINDVTRRDAL